jgi:hypothetical protein
MDQVVAQSLAEFERIMGRRALKTSERLSIAALLAR